MCLYTPEVKTEPIKDRELFLRYAVPCGHVLVKRGKISQAKLDRLRLVVIKGKKIKTDPGKTFKTAALMLSLLAKRIGKTKIDSGLIHRYFWFEHNRNVKQMAKLYPDINPKECSIKPAKVLHLSEKGALVSTPLGKMEVNIDFVPNIKKGDFVVIHYSFAVEKISAKQAKGLWRRAE